MSVFRIRKKTIGRPEGFAYPLGLSTDLTSNSATNTTGGVQTMQGASAVHAYTTSGHFYRGDMC